MTYEWKVVRATLAPAQPTYEPPQLADVLAAVERDGWEVFAILAEPATRADSFNHARVVARRPPVLSPETWARLQSAPAVLNTEAQDAREK